VTVPVRHPGRTLPSSPRSGVRGSSSRCTAGRSSSSIPTGRCAGRPVTSGGRCCRVRRTSPCRPPPTWPPAGDPARRGAGRRRRLARRLRTAYRTRQPRCLAAAGSRRRRLGSRRAACPGTTHPRRVAGRPVREPERAGLQLPPASTPRCWPACVAPGWADRGLPRPRQPLQQPVEGPGCRAAAGGAGCRRRRRRRRRPAARAVACRAPGPRLSARCRRPDGGHPGAGRWPTRCGRTPCTSPAPAGGHRPHGAVPGLLVKGGADGVHVAGAARPRGVPSS
jgi:hypothetical protein